MVLRTLVVPYNDLASVERLFDDYHGQIAAVIVEPVAANMGVVPPSPGFLEGLRRVTRADGALLIFDEVITGFRVARGGAQGRYGIAPDLTTLGKVIGGGLPIGAYGGRKELIDFVAPSGPVYQAGTMSGHPLAMVAGAATLDLLTPALYQRLERYAGRLERGIRAQAAAAGVRISVSRIGSLLTVFFRARQPTDFAQVKEADGSRFAGFHAALFNRGVLIPPSPHEAWFVSAVFGTRELDETTSAVSAALAAMAHGRSGRAHR